MPTWEDLQRAYQQQETAWNDYWTDLTNKAEDAKQAFQFYLGVTDNVIKEEGAPVMRKVMLGKETSGKWAECSRFDLTGSGKSISFGIGVTTFVERSSNGVFMEIALQRRNGNYLFELSHPYEVVQIVDASHPQNFNALSQALYSRFVEQYSRLPQ